MVIKIKKLVPEAKLPFRATAESAGADLYATSVIYDDKNDCWVYGTGISTQFPKEYVALIFPRSSNRKTDYYMPNSVGVVDADFRGEWLVCLKSRDFTNLRTPPYEVGDRIAQVVFSELPKVEFVETDELDDSERGTGGHGSTGK